MPKRRCGERDGTRTAELGHQHLYLVLDDWHAGYTIRKMSGLSADFEGTEKPLPRPLISFPAPRGCAKFFTSAFGSKIVLVFPCQHDSNAAPIIDIQERSVTYGTDAKYSPCPIYFPIGDKKLLTMDIGTFHLCVWTPEQPSQQWLWSKLPIQPFNRLDVVSYTMQPDGPIFVSTNAATFAFDVNNSVWKLHGEWVLPFTGRAHYDPSLEAFVGLSKEPETFGHLCSCTTDSTGTGDTGDSLHASPKWKCSKEKVYNKNPAERHVSISLVHMRRGKFCLVECVRTDQLEDVGVYLLQDAWNAGNVPQGCRYMYRLTTFSLRYDGDGDLKLKHCRVHCYYMPHGISTQFICQDPVAFWL